MAINATWINVHWTADQVAPQNRRLRRKILAVDPGATGAYNALIYPSKNAKVPMFLLVVGGGGANLTNFATGGDDKDDAIVVDAAGMTLRVLRAGRSIYGQNKYTQEVGVTANQGNVANPITVIVGGVAAATKPLLEKMVKLRYYGKLVVDLNPGGPGNPDLRPVDGAAQFNVAGQFNTGARIPLFQNSPGNPYRRQRQAPTLAPTGSRHNLPVRSEEIEIDEANHQMDVDGDMDDDSDDDGF